MRARGRKCRVTSRRTCRSTCSGPAAWTNSSSSSPTRPGTGAAGSKPAIRSPPSASRMRRSSVCSTESPTDLRAVPLCVVHSRAISTAAPLILDVIAASGQRARAEMMANNLVYTPDRMQAYRHLCALHARERDKDAARRCFEEVRRSLPSMPETHHPMAWFWVAEAASAAGLTDAVSAAEQASLESAFAIKGDGWDLPNGYFWAARACGLSRAKDGTVRIRAALDSLESGPWSDDWAQSGTAGGECRPPHRVPRKTARSVFGRRRYPRE